MPDLPPGDGRGVLVTRPEPGATETARRLAAAGWRPVIAPMLARRERPLRLPPPDAVQAVLVTSAAAIPALPAAFRGVPLLAVGDATAAAAAAAGFRTVASADGDAEALLALARRRCAPDREPLLLASAAGQGRELTVNLRGHGFRVHRRVAYEMRSTRRLPSTAVAALRQRGVTAALFYSPATGRAFVRAVPSGLGASFADVDAIVISAPAADAIAPLPWRSIRVASRPTQDELLALLT